MDDAVLAFLLIVAAIFTVGVIGSAVLRQSLGGRCRACGAAYPRKAQFCPRCGSKL